MVLLTTFGIPETISVELVRFGSNETPVIMFTDKGEEISLHYCEEQEIRGYVQCNGSDCILCSAGKELLISS